MKKHFILNRTLSWILLASLTLSLFTMSAFAADTGGRIVQEKIEQSLLSILPEPEAYGLDGVDMFSLYLGEAIAAYEVAGGALEKLDMVIYPIFDHNDRTVLIAAVTQRGNEPVVSLSNTFTDDLCAFSPDEELAFVYDNSGVFLFDGNELILLEQVPECADMGRDSIDTLGQAQLSALEGAFLSPCSRLSVPDIMSLGVLGSDDEEISLNVQIVKQSSNKTCWAAAMASMLNYGRISSQYLTENSIIKSYYGNDYDGESSPATRSLVNNVNRNYSASLQYVGNTNNARSDIWDALCGVTIRNTPYPVYGDFDGQDVSWDHAMVIRGMVGWELFSVMDPQVGTYSTGTINRSGTEFSITLPRTGHTYVLQYYAYKY
ncbi:MAG: hypothetical protein HFF39_02315 [Lawsonibacter sp.]|nr:hypothetical protein [Lawsonibacter sp.]